MIKWLPGHSSSKKVFRGTRHRAVGPSGSDKSTLLRTGNLPEIPDAGAIEIEEHRVVFEEGLRPPQGGISASRRQTGMVLQDFQLLPHRSVVANVMEGLVTVWKWPADKARRHARELLEKVGMSDKAEAWPAPLSGEQQ